MHYFYAPDYNERDHSMQGAFILIGQDKKIPSRCAQVHVVKYAINSCMKA